MIHGQENEEIPLSSSHLQHNHKNPGKKSNHFHISWAHSIASTVGVNSAGAGDRGCCVLGAAAQTEDEIMVAQRLKT